MKRILLVNPWIHDFSAFDMWLKPLGLLYIASYLESRGFSFDLLDCLDRFHPLIVRNGLVSPGRKYGTGKFISEEIPKPAAISRIPRRFKRFGIPYHLVSGFLSSLKDVEAALLTSSMTYWYCGVREMVDLIRTALPDTGIFLGGVYASLVREHAEAESGADKVFPGFNFLPVLAELGDREGDFNAREFFNSFSPAYHFYDSLHSVAMITSIGCPFRCTYCASNAIAPECFPLSHDKVLAEIVEYADKFGVRDIAFYDDALLWNAEAHFLPLFEKVIRKCSGIRFHAPNGIHARFISKEVARVLRLSGFRTIRIGLESCHHGFQEETGMKVTSEELIAAVGNLKGAGFSPDEIGIYLMAGRLDETAMDVLATLSFVEKLGVLAFVSEYSPVPGSRDWQCETEFRHADPLWQNNSIAFLKHGWTFDEMQRIRNEKNRINHSIVKS
jgi:hypothetical protein